MPPGPILFLSLLTSDRQISYPGALPILPFPESDESPFRRHLPSASGKENFKGRRRGSPIRPGEGSKDSQPGHSIAHRKLQLSPDIDSYCVTTSLAKQQGGCGSSGAPREENSNNAEVEEEELVAREQEIKDGDSACSTADPPADISFLLKWEKDKVRTS